MEELIIESGQTEKNYWKDLWKYRELLYILSWRDIKVRYKQTVIGAAWGVIRPVLTTIIFTILFNKVAKLSSLGSAPLKAIIRESGSHDKVSMIISYAHIINLKNLRITSQGEYTS